MAPDRFEHLLSLVDPIITKKDTRMRKGATRRPKNFHRLSRARRVIEKAFGILAARWRIFRWPIQGSVQTVQSITQAAVCLNNYLRQANNACYCPAGFVESEDTTGEKRPGEWRRIV